MSIRLSIYLLFPYNSTSKSSVVEEQHQGK